MQRAISWLPGARHMAARFIAGETLPDAINVIKQLNLSGINASLDFLGENTASLADAHLAAGEVRQIVEAISTAGLKSNVSIKLSQLGLGLDNSACRQNLAGILSLAKEVNNFIRIDMEDSSVTGETLETYKWARTSGYANTGIVIQAYLYRSSADISDLSQYQPRIRLCKGAYHEPSSIAFPKKQDVDQNYDRLANQILKMALELNAPSISENGRIPPIPAFATHDPNRIRRVIELAESIHFPRNSLEFQMLYGIRRDLQIELVRSGFQVRVYVPYGRNWYPYFMRRLAERPANVLFFLSQLLRK